jgi:predicted nucleic acid-binding protein
VQRVSHEAASTALGAIRAGGLFTVLDVDEDQFEAACNQFVQYDDQTITLVDHLSSVLADSKDASHVFTFDTDDFQTLGFDTVPDDIDS